MNAAAPGRLDKVGRLWLDQILQIRFYTSKAGSTPLQGVRQASLALGVKVTQASLRQAAWPLLEGDFCQDQACLWLACPSSHAIATLASRMLTSFTHHFPSGVPNQFKNWQGDTRPCRTKPERSLSQWTNGREVLTGEHKLYRRAKKTMHERRQTIVSQLGGHREASSFLLCLKESRVFILERSLKMHVPLCRHN